MGFWVQFTKKLMKDKLKKLLAETIGVDIEDINDDDSFLAELHMSASDLSDFVHSLEAAGFDTSRVDLTTIETVEELVEALDIHEEVK